MYKLTLTPAERSAIDWIGNRYAHGNDLYSLLLGCECPQFSEDDDFDWDCGEDIEFHVPEFIAWSIGEMGRENDYLWDCFADELAKKLTDFCMAIV